MWKSQLGLGVAIAVVASFRDRVVDRLHGFDWRSGLGGQVRPVSQMELRLKKLPTRLQTQLYPRVKASQTWIGNYQLQGDRCDHCCYPTSSEV